jgi:ankyrin repeat protein
MAAVRGCVAILLIATAWLVFRQTIAGAPATSALAGGGAHSPMGDARECVRNGEHARLARLLCEEPSLCLSADTGGMTLLHWAAAMNNARDAELLLSSGAVPGMCNRFGQTPLHFAAIGGRDSEEREGVVRLLVRRGAALDARDADGHTALHVAAMFGHRRVGALLVRLGADPDAPDADGKTAAALADAGGFEWISRPE